MKNKLFPNMKRLTTLFTLAILCITVIIITLRLTAFSDRTPDPASIDPSTGESLPADGTDSVVYSINRNIYFSSPDASGDIQIDNPAASPYDIRVSITRNDNGKTIYVSGALRPGSTIKTAKIQGARLPEGVYVCTAEVSTYEIGSSTKVNSTEVPITIYIGEEHAPTQTPLRGVSLFHKENHGSLSDYSKQTKILGSYL